MHYKNIKQKINRKILYNIHINIYFFNIDNVLKFN